MTDPSTRSPEFDKSAICKHLSLRAFCERCDRAAVARVGEPEASEEPRKPVNAGACGDGDLINRGLDCIRRLTFEVSTAIDDDDESTIHDRLNRIVNLTSYIRELACPPEHEDVRKGLREELGDEPNDS